jgi:acyl carrier protein
MAIPPPDPGSVIESFIRQHFRVAGGDHSFTRAAHLFEGGYVDSAGIVELLMFVESTFGVVLDDEHVFSDRFTSINGIAEIVASLHGGCREPDSAVR